jgi:hypothetical protein
LANWDFVFPYNQEHKEWFLQQNLPHPDVMVGNRLPTTADMKWALEQREDIIFDYPPGCEEMVVYERNATGYEICISGFDWAIDTALPQHDSFKMRWMGVLRSAILTSLCQRCGQLLMWPDTGVPAIIFQADQDSLVVAKIWSDSIVHEENAWAHFFERMYGDPALK